MNKRILTSAILFLFLALHPLMAQVKVVIKSNCEDLKVEIDGEYRRNSTEFSLPEGNHSFYLSAPEYKPVETELYVFEGMPELYFELEKNWFSEYSVGYCLAYSYENTYHAMDAGLDLNFNRFYMGYGIEMGFGEFVSAVPYHSGDFSKYDLTDIMPISWRISLGYSLFEVGRFRLTPLVSMGGLVMSSTDESEEYTCGAFKASAAARFEFAFTADPGIGLFVQPGYNFYIQGSDFKQAAQLPETNILNTLSPFYVQVGLYLRMGMDY